MVFIVKRLLGQGNPLESGTFSQSSSLDPKDRRAASCSRGWVLDEEAVGRARRGELVSRNGRVEEVDRA